MRVGIGYDVHSLAPGRPLIIGGVDIPFDKGLVGHSDADLLSHAIADALLGAAGLGNIGEQFPNDDPTWKGFSSIALLQRVNALLRMHKWEIINIDSTVNIEKPKLSQYIPLMRKNLSAALEISIDRVSVKATSGEGLGFVGAGEGASGIAVALLNRSGAGA